VSVGLWESIAKAFVDAENHKKYVLAQRQRQQALVLYQERYWKIGLALWEIVNANAGQLKIFPQKQPKHIATQHYLKPVSLSEYRYRLKHTPANSGDGRVTVYEVVTCISDELLLLGFAGFKIQYKDDFVTISGENMIITDEVAALQKGYEEMWGELSELLTLISAIADSRSPIK